MNALDYMVRQKNKNILNYQKEKNRGAPQEVLQNILKKIGFYSLAVVALEEQEKRYVCEEIGE